MRAYESEWEVTVRSLLKFLCRYTRLFSLSLPSPVEAR